MVGGLRDVITCGEFQIEIFIGYDFTGGRIFDFPIDFSMGLTTVQHYCARTETFLELKTLKKYLTEYVYKDGFRKAELVIRPIYSGNHTLAGRQLESMEKPKI